MWGQIAAAVAPSLIGGLLGNKGANAASQGAQQASQMQIDAANKAYEGGTYKPYGVTSGLGSSQFNNGQASFSLDPRYQQAQNQMQGLGQQAYTAAGGDYGQLANQFYNQQREMGAGSRNAEALALGGSMFGSGRTGLMSSGDALGFTGGGMMSPDGTGFAQAFAQQDSADRYNAQQQAQQQRQMDINIGNSMFNQSMGLDAAGMEQQKLGGMLGSQQSAANNAAGGNLVSGMGGGAESRQNQGLAQAGKYTGIGNALGNIGWDKIGDQVGGMFNPVSDSDVVNAYAGNMSRGGGHPSMGGYSNNGYTPMPYLTSNQGMGANYTGRNY